MYAELNDGYLFSQLHASKPAKLSFTQKPAKLCLYILTLSWIVFWLQQILIIWAIFWQCAKSKKEDSKQFDVVKNVNFILFYKCPNIIFHTFPYCKMRMWLKVTSLQKFCNFYDHNMYEDDQFLVKISMMVIIFVINCYCAIVEIQKFLLDQNPICTLLN